VASVNAEAEKNLPGSAIMVTPLSGGNHSFIASFTTSAI